MITSGLHDRWVNGFHPVTIKQKPQNEAESLLCSSVTHVIGLSEDISMDESFFRRGGDSVAAMMLVGMLRERGYQLTVADVFENPRLDTLATKMSRATVSSDANLPRQFGLLGDDAESIGQLFAKLLSNAKLPKKKLRISIPAPRSNIRFSFTVRSRKEHFLLSLRTTCGNQSISLGCRQPGTTSPRHTRNCGRGSSTSKVARTCTRWSSGAELK
jgi:aryl carrier-like protein